MKNARWAQVDRLLDEALERAPHERAAFLAAACASDEDLHREVASLLAAHDQAAGSFLQLPALEVAAQKLGANKQPSLLGQTISHYSIISVLGVGGMGEVYLARDTRLDRNVALKFLPPHYTQDAGRVERFEREARAASALNHPNIITIYEIGQTDRQHFIAAEYIAGRTLRELIGKGRVPVKEALEIAVQIADALAATHEAGIVHRDIKPENVMQRHDGYVKVLDFGLVKLIERPRSRDATNADAKDVGRTNPGTVLGTISYMSPEQALGRAVDRRSDIFSLGVVLYELVTGAQPFKGHTTAALLDAIVHHPPLPLTQLQPGLPSELERIVNRALEKDRELRYQSADDLRAELKRLQRELDSAAIVRPSQPIPRPPLKPARSRWRMVALLVAALLLASVAGWGWWRAPGRDAERAGSPWSKAIQQPLTEGPEMDETPSLAPDGQSLVYARRLNDQWDIFWQRVGGNKPLNLTGGAAVNDTSPAYSHDGKLIVFRSERDNGGLFVMGETGENVRRIAPDGFSPAWSPDDREVVYATRRLQAPNYQLNIDGHLEVINRATEVSRRIVGSDGGLQPHWSPTGKRIAYWSIHHGGQRDIWTIAAAGGQPVAITDDPALDWCPVWAPDGRHLYFVSDRAGRMGLFRVQIDEETGQRLSEPEFVPTQSPYSFHPSFSADGRKLAYVELLVKENIQRIGFDPVKETVVGQAAWVTQVARRPANHDVSPDGQWLVYYSYSEPQMDLYVVRSDGSERPRQITSDTFKDRQPRWSPDGNRIAYFSDASGHYEIWLINPDGSGRRQLTFHDGGDVLDPAWSPDGKHLSYAQRHGGGFIIEVDKPWREQTPIALPPLLGGGQFVPEDWSPDGKKIAGVRLSRDGVAPGVVVYSLATRQYEQVTRIGEFGSWLRDGQRVTFVHQDKIYLAHVQTGAVRELLALPPLLLNMPRLAFDQRQLYFLATEREQNIWLLGRN